MLEAIKVELEFNQRLRIDFPEIAGQGRVWQAATIITKANQKVQVASSGKKLRGLRHGAYRLIWWYWMILKMTNKCVVRTA